MLNPRVTSYIYLSLIQFGSRCKSNATSDGSTCRFIQTKAGGCGNCQNVSKFSSDITPSACLEFFEHERLALMMRMVVHCFIANSFRFGDHDTAAMRYSILPNRYPSKSLAQIQKTGLRQTPESVRVFLSLSETSRIHSRLDQRPFSNMSNEFIKSHEIADGLRRRPLHSDTAFDPQTHIIMFTYQFFQFNRSYHFCDRKFAKKIQTKAHKIALIDSESFLIRYRLRSEQPSVGPYHPR
jgi:hypothetical protein